MLIIYLIILILISNEMNGKQIIGHFDQLKNQIIKLEGYHGFNTYTIDSVHIDDNGNFLLSYNENNIGIGYLINNENKPFILILSGEDIELKGESLSKAGVISIVKGADNILFDQYINEQVQRNKMINSLNNIEHSYINEKLFNKHNEGLMCIQNEKEKLLLEATDGINSIPSDSFLNWYIKTRLLINSIYVLHDNDSLKKNHTIDLLRNFNYADERLYTSGLLKELIDGHLWALSNYTKSKDLMIHEIKMSIDTLISQLSTKGYDTSSVIPYLFILFEKQRFFELSEYLYNQLTNHSKIIINNELHTILESYKAIINGNKAPNIIFGNHSYFPENIVIKDLYDIKSSYKLIIFAASWCEHCLKEIPYMAQFYEQWKKLDLETIMISLDETPVDFANFAAGLPFISSCDYLKWNSIPVKDYFVYGTPSMFLLNKSNQIISRPTSVDQITKYLESQH